MTKVFALLSIAAVCAFASCENKTTAETPVDSVGVTVPADTTPVAAPAGDSASVKADSAAPAPAAH